VPPRKPIPLVDLSRQHSEIIDELGREINEIVRTCDFIGGARVQEFEHNFAEYCDARHCVSLGNGTDAITIALKALGIGAGDEVIVPAVSFFASAEAVSNAGATVVFCEIDSATANIDARRIPDVLTPRTRAILPVHLYGQPADMDGILGVAAKHGLRVIEDCAQAVGARHRSRRVGTLGDIGCFSFYPSKNLGAFGDGGAIVTNDSKLAETCRMLGNHGGLRRYEHQVLGYNSRLDTIQAAVLTIKLKYLDDWTRLRKEVAAHYTATLQNSSIEQLATLPEVEHVHHLFTVRVNRRDEVAGRLKDAGVDANVHYPAALPGLAPYASEHKDARATFAKATAHAERTLSLPIFPMITRDEVDYVSKTLLQAVTDVPS
jgi:dTDP-4-amino-4,6-dideoxygalactose transaminase